jgi:hypothetical protein
MHGSPTASPALPPRRAQPARVALTPARERRGWLRHLVAWAIGVGLLLGARVLVDDADRAAALVQISDEDQPHLRWRFTDITPAAFRWTADASYDHGKTRLGVEEMHARAAAEV